MSHSWRFHRLILIGQPGIMDIGIDDIVAVDESHHISDFAADSVRVPLRLSKTVSGCWCRVRCSVHFDIAGTLKQKSDQQCQHRWLRHQKSDLTSTKSSELLAVDSIGK